MAISEQNRIWEKSTMEGSALLVLLAIGDSADKEYGHGWPGRAHLMHYGRLSDEATVTRIIKRIEWAGEIAVARCKGKSNHYVVLVDLPDADIERRVNRLITMFPAHKVTPDLKSLLKERGSDPTITSTPDPTVTTTNDPVAPISNHDPSVDPSVDPSLLGAKKSSGKKPPKYPLLATLSKSDQDEWFNLVLWGAFKIRHHSGMKFSLDQINRIKGVAECILEAGYTREQYNRYVENWYATHSPDFNPVQKHDALPLAIEAFLQSSASNDDYDPALAKMRAANNGNY